MDSKILNCLHAIALLKVMMASNKWLDASFLVVYLLYSGTWSSSFIFTTLKAGSTNPGSDKVVLMLELLQLVQHCHHTQQSYFIKAITYVTRDFCWWTAVKILHLKFRVSFIICTCGCVAYIYIYAKTWLYGTVYGKWTLTPSLDLKP